MAQQTVDSAGNHPTSERAKIVPIDRATPAQGRVVARGFGAQYRANVGRLGRAQLGPAGTPPVTRFVARPLGRRLAAVAAMLRITPNGLTALSLVVWGAGLAVLCLAPPTPYAGVGAALLLVIGDALDSADGQLARLSRTDGAAGRWLDRLADQLRAVSFHLGVLVWLYRYVDPASSLPYALPLAWVLLTCCQAVTREAGAPPLAPASASAESTGSPSAAAAHRRPSVGTQAQLRAVLLLPADPALLCWLVVLAGAPSLLLTTYAVLLALGFLITLVALRGRYVELRRRPRAV